MFAGRYFAARYYPARYFPKVGAEAVFIPPPPRVLDAVYGYEPVRRRPQDVIPVPLGFGKNLPPPPPADPRLKDPTFRRNMDNLAKANQAVADRKREAAQAEQARLNALTLARAIQKENEAKRFREELARLNRERQALIKRRRR